MKKLFIVALSVCLFNSCVTDTVHSFGVQNSSSDTLEFRCKIHEEPLFDTIAEPNMSRSFKFETYWESGKEDRLSNEDILNHFEFFEFVKGLSDTFKLNIDNIDSWLIHGEFIDDYKQHSYRIKVTDEDLE
jgi:hypothetical protein